jgi:hypothetical protein
MIVCERPALPNRFSAGALAITLLVALLACAAGAALAWQEPALPPTHHAVPRSPGTRAAPPAPVTVDGSQVTGTIDAVDQQLGAIRIRVGAVSYVYLMSDRTTFPDSCLTRADLRAGQAVRLILPWYLGGNVTIEALAPRAGCGPVSRSGKVLSHTEDSPPSETGPAR